MDISVVTPFYKGNRYMSGLFACIRGCAEAAPHLKTELVLVNDSPDCPVEYRQDWVQGFTVRVLVNEVNSGIHRSRVNGIAAAQGEFIQLLDQDDLLEPAAFASQYAAIAQADVSVANGRDQNPHNPGPIYKSLAHQRQAAIPRFYWSVGNQIVSPGQCLIRKSAIPESWKRDFVSRNGSDDLLLWLYMFGQNRRFTVNPDTLYTHVDTGENVSADVKKMAASSMEVLELLKKNGCVTPRQERQFRRSCAVGVKYMGAGKAGKLLTMLCHPAAAAERAALLSYRFR